jgi:hypothetical protein
VSNTITAGTATTSGTSVSETMAGITSGITNHARWRSEQRESSYAAVAIAGILPLPNIAKSPHVAMHID